MGLLDSCVLLVIIVSFCAYINYQYVTDWNSISLEDIALSNIIPLFWLTIIRLFFAMVIWGSTGISVLDPEGLKLELRNREGKYVKIIIKHFQRLTFFTFWCWMLHGVYFVLTGIASLSILLGFNLKDMIGAKWIHALCALVWVTYEVCSFSN